MNPTAKNAVQGFSSGQHWFGWASEGRLPAMVLCIPSPCFPSLLCMRIQRRRGLSEPEEAGQKKGRLASGRVQCLTAAVTAGRNVYCEVVVERAEVESDGGIPLVPKPWQKALDFQKKK